MRLQAFLEKNYWEALFTRSMAGLKFFYLLETCAIRTKKLYRTSSENRKLECITMPHWTKEDIANPQPKKG